MENNNDLNFQNQEIRLAATLLAVLLISLVASVVFGLKNLKDVNIAEEEAARVPFTEVALEAKAAYVYDVRTKTAIFAKEENARLPLASLTKIMSALTALELGETHRTVVITPEALRMEGESGFKNGERWSLKDLLNFSLVTSSNDGMHAVALALGALEKADASTDEIVNDFVGTMNRKASQLGLKNTYFWNETGLDESDIKGGAYGSARDVSTLFEYILDEYPELFDATRDSITAFRSLDNAVHLARNTNLIIPEIPGLLASKTGYTNTAGGNLAIIFDPELGRPIIVVVLGSSSQGRFEDVKILVSATLEYIHNNNLPCAA